MDTEELMRAMIRYLEDKGFWMGIVPVALAMANRTPGGLIELGFYVLDQGRGLTQENLVDRALSIGRKTEPHYIAERCLQTA